MASLLIDLNKMKIIKACEGKDATRRLEYWADILIPKSDFYIGGEANRDFSVFTLMELKMLYRNTCGEEITRDDYQWVTIKLYDFAQRIDTDDTELGDLVKKLKRPLAVPSTKPQKETRSNVNQKQATGRAKRPGAGTTTARVWEIADELKGRLDDNNLEPCKDFESKEFRQWVIDSCGKETINPSTAATQFAKWKRDQLTS